MITALGLLGVFSGCGKSYPAPPSERNSLILRFFESMSRGDAAAASEQGTKLRAMDPANDYIVKLITVQQSNTFLQRAQGEINAGNIDRALEFLDEGVKTYPANRELARQRGKVRQLRHELKGLPLGVGICWQMLSHFEVWNLELDDLTPVRYGAFAERENEPAFHRGFFEAAEVADTFLEFPGVKGVVWVNGFNLGRYWNIGPGNALYVPAPVLRKGRNEVVVLELHKLNAKSVTLSDRPQLD